MKNNSTNNNKSSKKDKFEKVLWKSTTFSDNYVPEDFYQNLKAYRTPSEETYVSLVKNFNFTIILRYQIVLLYVLIFNLLDLKPALTNNVLLIFLSFSSVNLIIFYFMMRGYFEDSIYNLTIIALIFNSLYHDYTDHLDINIQYPTTISINFGIFSSVLLSSRLHSDFQVFSFLFISIVIFHLFPIFERYLRHYSSTLTFLYNLVLLTINSILIIYLNFINLIYINICVLIAIQFVLPAWFYKLVRGKV
ncbi:hypothetical protein CONCODRAFT_80820 [Conidiobolus coronatus NRRL 28638]|uniref:Phosphatidylinositol N-acetylglucosaminyltransferase n=1 Tax=Conidiobolus coronatus (strain ATCC 28846 / CBS 209.66 / NRRL 28638) TaxID=796925 RepID=A0A137NR59_CONC2|nr:hypothetical protein CONCODRAFT_80820 [Conidiobolus coronatus NRRL 28638]|eukprot:KXN65256.1 hypothetical protein CONCODRAFT_80820 [Conidiobolus coronatus NRRL 28638]